MYHCNYLRASDFHYYYILIFIDVQQENSKYLLRAKHRIIITSQNFNHASEKLFYFYVASLHGDFSYLYFGAQRNYVILPFLLLWDLD